MSNDDEMSDAERQMLEMLGGDAPADDTPKPADAPKPRAARPPAPEPTPVSVHRVDVEPLKETTAAAPDMDGNLKLILDIPVEIKVEVGTSRLTIREVLNLAPGSILELDRTAGSPADLIVNGTSVGQGDVVVVDESYGIRITKLVKPEDRINSL
ncbi:MAG TPA: flagellar motor switch protein FliN [Verrucomicrobia bacterium]|nr:flagellar motor switch protein FliN [Verrucomicrobiota bacterium]